MMTKTRSVITVVLLLLGSGLFFHFFDASVSSQAQNRDDSTSGASPTRDDDVVASRANYQRTGFYKAKGVHDLNGVIWKTPKLFSLEKKQRFDDDSPIDFDAFFFGEYGATPPIHANGVICFSLYVGDGYLVALDATTGRQIWTFKRERGHVSDPTIVGNLVYVGIGARTIVGLNAKTGKEEWRFSAPNPVKPVKGLWLKLMAGTYAPTPIVTNRLIVFGTMEGDLYAVDQATKELKWSFQADGLIGPMAVANGAAYFGTLSKSAYSVDLASGHQKWKIDAELRRPLASNGFLYFNDKGTIYAVDAATGQTKWKAKTRAKTGTDLGFAYDTIYVAGLNDSIYALDANTGQEKWRFKTSEACDPPVIADGVVYAGVYEQLLAIDAHAGTQLWIHKDKKATMSSPAVTDGVLYVLDYEGHVYALR